MATGITPRRNDHKRPMERWHALNSYSKLRPIEPGCNTHSGTATQRKQNAGFYHLDAERIDLRLMPFPITGLKISPSRLMRATAFSMVKSFICKPFFTSSQCSGMETVAPGLGRKE